MPWEITAEELLARYADGERNFAGIELIQSEGVPQEASIDLEGAILRDINLRGADLCRADLCRADLTGADLFGVSLESAWLKRAIVRDANLYSANLSWCDLTEADLRGTDLNHMNASRAAFCRANIGGFSYAILAHANFRSADVSEINICKFGNLIWQTTMPDGTIKSGPFFGEF
ncbi:MAG: pentapeptide repeat-containing protein [Nostoc sp. NOS(2021)]|uniref:pentapeptide repeat-containing protein n=1 Tax=Nostoc sp. NOS(2021) TaxID=2815407 RepID=UPI0025DCF6DE|nr:pentapeptide repeat-containing protein [Nostoc sp. NOS(2021)]MBN3894263.1 pentapeptide repeat-containing protein [Nostoc sp. NOS(2021)]